MSSAPSPARSGPPPQVLTLFGRQVLIVEDEPLLALDMASGLRSVGAVVVGPARDLAEAVQLLTVARIDAAVLDVDLGGVEVFPLADELMAAAVPFVFTTGRGEVDLPGRFAHAAHFPKPVDVARVSKAVCRAIRRNPPPAWSSPRR